jgi:tRNA nucleotidyltransferase (CCA-adding enzyme)
MEDKAFERLRKLYASHGFRLYVVGGTARDLLLGRPYADEDFATDATPEEEKAFLLDADYSFARFGSVMVRQGAKRIDVTTLRVEEGYDDFRHPAHVSFVKEPRLDAARRDFTVNALYLDEAYRILDYVGGLDDLRAKIIRFIGDPERRVREDPLRIIRGERFAATLGFSIEPKTYAAMAENRYLLRELNPAKIEEERRKGWKGEI